MRAEGRCREVDDCWIVVCPGYMDGEVVNDRNRRNRVEVGASRLLLV
jgi:hypothetical protein